MEDILIRSPRASLASDLYDLSLAINDENGESRISGNEGYPGESSVAQGEAAEEILSFYERLDVNPRVLFSGCGHIKIYLTGIVCCNAL